MTGMVMDAGHTLNHQRHPRQRPEIRVEAVGPRSLPQRPLHLPELPEVELWFAARPPGAVEGADTAALPLCVPSAHALTAHSQLTSNRGQNHLAGGKQAAGLFAAVFELLKIAARTNACRHSSSIVHAPLDVTIFREVVTVLCEVQ
jgi:hypothetical protein